ncbi:MAG TPA: thioredoxin family protein [Bacillota bacterium]|jgi:thioredoxin 1|nr:thioredoxin family protein [Bacillota bacterium]HOL11165.1 thioredoxin family protein [Bacillota bacterium]
MNLVDNLTIVQNEHAFNQIIKQQAKVIALIYATWCPFCRRFLPVFKQHAQGRSDFVLVEDNQEIVAYRFDIEIIPTILYFKGGEVVKRLDGYPGEGLNEEQFLRFLDSLE